MIKKLLILTLLFLSFSVYGQSGKAVQLQEKYWYISCDSIISPENSGSLLSFTSDAANPEDYCAWRFEDDNKLGYGHLGGTFVCHDHKWHLRGKMIRIGKNKFKILLLTDKKLTLEKR